jgi:hypothetical protein
MTPMQLSCDHIFDGPRIVLAPCCTIGTCSKCGTSAYPELTGPVLGKSDDGREGEGHA